MTAKGLWAKLWCESLLDWRTSPATLDPVAWSLWTRGILLAKQNDTDGEIRREEARMLAPTTPLDELDRACKLLVANGLWEPTETGYRVPLAKWQDRQQTREEREKLSAARAEAGRKGGKGQANAKQSGSKVQANGSKPEANPKQPEAELELESRIQSIQVSSEESVVQSNPARGGPNANGSDNGFSQGTLDGSDGFDPRRLMRTMALLEPMRIDKRNRAKAMDLIREIMRRGGDPCAVLARVANEIKAKRVASPGGYAYRSLKAEAEALGANFADPPTLTGAGGPV